MVRSPARSFLSRGESHQCAGNCNTFQNMVVLAAPGAGAARHVRPRQRAFTGAPRLRTKTPRSVVAVNSTDYIASATDSGVLQLPLKEQLQEDQLKHVFQYDRDLQGR